MGNIPHVCAVLIIYRLHSTSVVGNTSLEKWSPSSLRRAGLCEDHFSEDDFVTGKEKRLKRKAIPTPFAGHLLLENEAIPARLNEIKTITALQESHTKKKSIESIKENIASSSSYGSRETISTSISLPSTSNDVVVDEELHAHPVMKTYKPPPHLVFHNCEEEEDAMEWMHFEPPMPRETPTPKPSLVANPKENTNIENITDLKHKITLLQQENARLRRKLRNVTYCRRAKAGRKKPTNKKQKNRC